MNNPTDQLLITLALALPAIGLLVAIFRYLIGINVTDIPQTLTVALFSVFLVRQYPSFYIFAPLSILATFVAIYLLTFGMLQILRRLSIFQLSRLNLLFMTTAVSILFVTLLAPSSQTLSLTILIVLATLPIVEPMAESFLAGKFHDATAQYATSGLIVFLSAILFASNLFTEFVTNNLVLSSVLAIVLNLLIGRYKGLRLVELWNFREIIFKDND